MRRAHLNPGHVYIGWQELSASQLAARCKAALAKFKDPLLVRCRGLSLLLGALVPRFFVDPLPSVPCPNHSPRSVSFQGLSERVEAGAFLGGIRGRMLKHLPESLACTCVCDGRCGRNVRLSRFSLVVLFNCSPSSHELTTVSGGSPVLPS